MKKTATVTISIILILMVLYPLLWIAASAGLFGDIGYGYYGDYNFARRAVQKAECVEAIEHELKHEDITLENFGFTLRTKSGWKLTLSFVYEMNVRKVCVAPKGILVDHPSKGMQVYTVEYLSGLFKDKEINLKGICEILCNLDELVPVFRANCDNDMIPCASDIRDEYLDYLNISWGPWRYPTTRSFEASEPKSTETKERVASAGKGLTLRNLEFDVVTLDASGTVKNSGKRRAQYYVEDLGGGVGLEMVHIPAGKFLMGTSEAEAAVVAAEYKRYRGQDFTELWHESPQHEVTVPPFFMGRFEVTQAQWRAVAQLPRVKIDLRSDPSEFKGDDLPVDSISWDEAIEFCSRLSRATGREYRLPSEAEWEYACRAGTTTQFHFGNLITTELANYDGVYPYGSSLWGVDRETTTPVGSFGAPNAFGLYDMHGNVDEMCLDVWHDTYNGAPRDGSAWITGADDSVHVTRGGVYYSNPWDLRTASRGRNYQPAKSSYKDGLRVVAVARNK